MQRHRGGFTTSMIAATECLITVEPILVQSEIIAIQPVSTGVSKPRHYSN